MDFVIKRQAELFEYRHKKFDQCKRLQCDEDAEITFISEMPAGGHTPKLKRRATMALEDQRTDISSPYSISSDSNCSSDFHIFAERYRETSTPLVKRRKVCFFNQPQQQQLSQYDDSGLGMTPQKALLNQSSIYSPVSSRVRTPFAMRKSHTPIITRLGLAKPSEAIASSVRTTVQPPDQLPVVMPAGPLAAASPVPLPKVAPALTVTEPPVAATAAAILPKISQDTLRSICKYHGNMVRQFPKKERTPKDQERRNKNTIACRMSRRVKKLENIAIEEQYKEYNEKHMQIVESSMRAAAYLQQLMKLVATENTDNGESNGSDVEIDVVGIDDLAEKKRSFSIAFLMGAQNH